MTLLLLVVGIVGSLWRAVVAATLWGWFVIPVTGLPPISVAMAFGLVCVVGVFNPSIPDPDRDPEEVLIIALSMAMNVLIVLGAAWVALQFVGGAA